MKGWHLKLFANTIKVVHATSWHTYMWVLMEARTSLLKIGEFTRYSHFLWNPRSNGSIAKFSRDCFHADNKK